jgi:diaminohydroxyphosphoribosylaminopyrimidine deaminase/5-amino-6-(5-phosphoribosylamino)uracil reductase
VYTQSSEAGTLLVTADNCTEEALRPYLAVGTEVIQVPRNPDGLDLKAALVELGKRNLHSLLLEGGSTLGGATIRAGLVDRVMIFVAPKLLGGVGRSLLTGEGVDSISDACMLTNLRSRQVDTDILIEGEVQHVHRTD